MMQNFLLQRSLSSYGKQTYVNWSLRNVNKAVVFIHGFSGSSLETFGDFNIEFRFRSEYFDHDVYFYGYDSLRVQTVISSNTFFSFLEAIQDNLNDIIAESGVSVQRTEKYSEIVIVAHSLGAVVARYALLIGVRKNMTWLENCKLVLFAPAHKGAKKAVKLYNQLPGFLKYIGPLTEFFVVTINEVMEGSDLIREIEEKYLSLLQKGTYQFAIAKKVVWAELDKIVNCSDFANDPSAEVFIGRNHTNVCKPSNSFIKPFEIVESVLKQNP
jgi:hypothetical protein